MSTFAPGPWAALFNGCYWDIVSPWLDEEEPRLHGPTVANVYNSSNVEGWNEKMAERHARLFAAAPDLLDALALLIKSAEDMQGTLRQMDRSRDELDKMGDECAKDAQYAIDCAKQAIAAAGGAA